jgi:hypothetical protein
LPGPRERGVLLREFRLQDLFAGGPMVRSSKPDAVRLMKAIAAAVGARAS